MHQNVFWRLVSARTHGTTKRRALSLSLSIVSIPSFIVIPPADHEKNVSDVSSARSLSKSVVGRRNGNKGSNGNDGKKGKREGTEEKATTQSFQKSSPMGGIADEINLSAL